MRLQSPMPGYKVTTRYGPRGPVAGLPAGLHNGDDYAAPSGTPVYAAAAGTARNGYEAGGFGNYVVIAHGDALTTWYAHLSRTAVSNGQKVKAGQLIGYVGSTGASTGPHLHFSARRGGTWIDPQTLMQSTTPAPSTSGDTTMFMIYLENGAGKGSHLYAVVGSSFWLEFSGQASASNINQQLAGGTGKPALKVSKDFWAHCKKAATTGKNK